MCRFNTYRFVNKVYPRVYPTIYAVPCPHDSPLSDPFLYSACLTQSQFGVFSTAPPQGATQIEVNGKNHCFLEGIVDIEYILAFGVKREQHSKMDFLKQGLFCTKCLTVLIPLFLVS